MNPTINKKTWLKFIKLKRDCKIEYTNSDFLEWLLEIYTETMDDLDE